MIRRSLAPAAARCYRGGVTGTPDRPSRRGGSALLWMALAACGGGGTRGAAPTPTELRIADAPGDGGVFDPAPMSDGAGGLWMSYSAVATSAHATPAAPLDQVRTRLASSSDAGATFADLGLDPSGLADADLQVPDGQGGLLWATWRFEVSRLLFDPYDPDAARRWKIVWHRLVAAAGGEQGVAHFETGWVGESTAPDPRGPWSAERKLLSGAGYSSAMDAFIGPPELPLSALFPGPGALGGCAFFSEPGLLARPEGIYLSLLCAGTPSKTVLLRCDHAFSSCDYLGDLLQDAEAASFSTASDAYQGFSGSELVETARAVYLIVTPWVNPPEAYRGCLAFRVSDLATATVERSAGAPVLVARISGVPGSFHGACGYHPDATGSGIVYGQYQDVAPHYHIFESHLTLP